MSLADRIRTGTYVAEADAEGARAACAGRGVSLAETARRVVAEGELMPAVRDFLDQAGRLPATSLEPLLVDRPLPTGRPEADALLAGIAEHLALARGLRCPNWSCEPERFLERFWFVSRVPGFRAIALAQTPVALKRRGIFWPARSMERV